jgi:hypothetical protein
MKCILNIILDIYEQVQGYDVSWYKVPPPRVPRDKVRNQNEEFENLGAQV